MPQFPLTVRRSATTQAWLNAVIAQTRPKARRDFEVHALQDGLALYLLFTRSLVDIPYHSLIPTFSIIPHLRQIASQSINTSKSGLRVTPQDASSRPLLSICEAAPIRSGRSPFHRTSDRSTLCYSRYRLHLLVHAGLVSHSCPEIFSRLVVFRRVRSNLEGIRPD